MARTIGVKNKNLVKKLTKKEMTNETVNIEDAVIEALPSKLWHTWESADSEIRRIIWDVMFDKK